MMLRRNQIFVVLLISAAGLSWAGHPVTGESRAMALVGGTLIDGTGADPIPDAVVVIRDGHIQSVGTSRDALPTDVMKINVAGATVLPGFINAHVHSHYDEKNLKAWAQAGVTTVRDLSGPYFTISDPFSHVGKLNQEKSNARLLAAGPMVTVADGYPIVPWGGRGLEVSSPEDARVKVNALLEDGADIIKIALEGGTILPGDPTKMLTQDEARTIVEVAHERDTLVSAHVTSADDLPLALDAGVDDIAHMVADGLPPEIARRMVAQDIYWVPTLELWKCVGGGYRTAAVQNLSLFVREGGKVALGTDFNGYNCAWQLGMPITEMELMGEAGMTPMQIIVAGTMNAAHVCNMENDLGTIEEGKIADVIVVAGDPLVDIHNLLNVRMVIHDGIMIRNEIEQSAGLSWHSFAVSITFLYLLSRFASRHT